MLPPPSPASADRCERYRQRIDAHLKTLPDDAARREFLDAEDEKWVHRFETFQREVAAGRYKGDATAFEFHISMSDVNIRRARYARRQAQAA